jgi:fatty-acyl-CoA synthase
MRSWPRRRSDSPTGSGAWESREGDRVATLLWNTWPHLVAYLAIPNIGAVIHTLNLRLHPNDLAYIAHHAEDKVLIVEDSLVPLYEQFRDRAPFRQVIVVGNATKVPGALSYAELIQQHEPDERALVDVHWNTPAFLLYTSGTTGEAEGVCCTCMRSSHWQRWL